LISLPSLHFTFSARRAARHLFADPSAFRASFGPIPAPSSLFTFSRAALQAAPEEDPLNVGGGSLEGDLMDGGDGDGAPSGGCPGDFGDAEHEKSFNVNPNEGLSVVFQNSLGAQGRDSGALVVQGSIGPSGASAV
jgi:hypothetical protein